MAADLIPAGDEWARSWRQASSAGSFRLGPAAINWERSFGAWPRDERAKFTASVGASTATVVVSAIRPFSSQLRKGVPVDVDDRRCELKRNGPRLSRRQRSIAVRCGSDTLVEARVADHEAQIHRGERVIWTSRGGGLVAADASAEDLAVSAMLLATDVLATTSWLSVLRGV